VAPPEPVNTKPLSVGRKVAAFIDDDITTGTIRSGLASLGAELEIHPGTIRAAIRYFEREAPAQALIVDISGVDNPQAALDQLARVCPPYVRVFVIGENTDIGFYRMLLQDMGVAEYLPKPVSRDVVLRLLLPSLSGVSGADERRSRGGHLVCVCGARGGVGTSSLALNLAFELMGTIKGHVALVDLHVQGGELALMLGVHPGPGLRIALEDADRVDSLFLERASIEIEPRLRLIASEDAFNSTTTATEAGIARVLEVLRQEFNYIVADIPMPVPAQMMRVLAAARQVVTVLTPDVASLRDTQNIRQLVTSITGADRVITVLNRSDMKGGVGLPLIEKAIGGRPDVVIPDLGPKMLRAINMGVPAVRRIPALKRYLAPLVREIAGVHTDKSVAGRLRRLFRS
jgi:pilus assembly protein CpaE